MHFQVYRRHGIEDFLTYLKDIGAHVYMFETLSDDLILNQDAMKQAAYVISQRVGLEIKEFITIKQGKSI